MEFDKGDVIYYKVAMKKLLEEAKENNVQVNIGKVFGVNQILFKNDIEIAGVMVK